MKKSVLMIITVLLGVSLSSASFADNQKNLTTAALPRAHFFSLDRFEKTLLAKKIFGLNSDGVESVPENVLLTESFKPFSTADQKVPSKIKFAAQKVFKKYEEKTRENVSMLEARVVYEPAQENMSEIPWLILIVKKTITYKGDSKYSPVGLYMIDRSSGGETVIQLNSRFDEPVL